MGLNATFALFTQRKMKKIVLFLILSVGVLSASQAQTAAPLGNALPVDATRYFASVDSMINLGKKYMGVRYTYGGNTPTGFDCSGFVSYLFGSFGYKISRASRELAKFGYEVNEGCLQPGDLAFFKGRSTKSNEVGHVALVIKAMGGQWDIIHATVSRGIWIDHDVMNIAYYKQRFLMFRRPFQFL